ncbi:hypothetical protein Tco_1222332, partial [Tanacetum coccineum]
MTSRPRTRVLSRPRLGVLQLPFIIPTLERVTIGCCEVGGGGGGRVVGGVGVVCGDGVDRGVRGVDYGFVYRGCLWWCVLRRSSWSHGTKRKGSFVKCDMMRNDNFVGVQVKAPISAMIVRVPEKDRWCGTRGKDVIVDGGGRRDI